MAHFQNAVAMATNGTWGDSIACGRNLTTDDVSTGALRATRKAGPEHLA